MILDVDATEIEGEKQEAAWTYHHVQGYMPLVGYVDGVCVGHEFREGNQSPGAGILSSRRVVRRRCRRRREFISAATVQPIKPR